MKRMYQPLVEEHVHDLDQMVFMPGPRQVGKTTIAKRLCQSVKHSLCLNWDILNERKEILAGPQHIIDAVLPAPSLANSEPPIVALDEIHKMDNWKNYLKGYFDQSKGDIKTLVTGSAKLDIYQKGGDSLMGRYFLYRIHPLSVGELLNQGLKKEILTVPMKLPESDWETLFKFGGFPEPFLRADERFYNRWQQLRFKQLFQEEIKDTFNITDIKKMEVLASMLQNKASEQMKYHQLAKLIQVSDKTIAGWLNTLESFYFAFSIKPWHKNVSRALIKEPKYYLWDWSTITDMGAKVENFFASHLLKAVHYWQDIGLGQYDLHYLRDKDKREVDFLVTKNQKPWILIEVKTSNNQSISEHLYHFQKQVQAEHVFQVVFDIPYVDKDCFAEKGPIIIPMKTFLSQLP